MNRPGLTAGLTAFCLFGFETLAHRQLMFVGYNNEAVTALSLAVMGLGVGAAGAWLLRARSGSSGGTSLALGAAIATAALMAAGFAAFPLCGVALSSWGLPALLLPFVAGGALLGICFTQGEARRVYALDLLGAAAGSAALGPLLIAGREEGAQLVFTGAACLLPALVGGGRARRLGVGAALMCLLAAGGNALTGTYDLARATVTWSQSGPRKVFEFVDLEGKAVITGASSLAARVDLIEGDDGRFTGARLFVNGNWQDTARTTPVDGYVWDPRVPSGFQGDAPDVYIIGTSAEGVLKSTRRLGGAVTGSEINTAILRLFDGGPARDRCADCYQGVSVRAADGRLDLASRTERYDLITLLNTHRELGRLADRGAEPSYLHTREAVSLYLSRLTGEGLLNWEQPFKNNQGRVTLRLLATISAALEEDGAEDPAQHIVVFSWMNSFHQVLVRKAPWDEASLAGVRAWLAGYAASTRGVDTPFDGQWEPLWFPDKPRLRGPVADFLRSGAPPAGYTAADVSPVTDARPFLMFSSMSSEPLYRSGLLVLLLGGLAALLPAAGALRRRPEPALASLLAAAALSGWAFMLLEITWLQQLQRLLGPPGVTVPMVLVGLLLSSGLGGWLSGSRLARPALMALPLVLATAAVSVSPLLALAAAAPAPARLLIGLGLVAVPGLAMGVVFPRAVDRARGRYGEGYAALLLAVNGGASAAGAISSHLLATTWGFAACYLAGAALYAAAGALLLREVSAAKLRWGVGVAALGAAAALAALIGGAVDRTSWETALRKRAPWWTVYAVEYARSGDVPRRELVQGARPGESVAMSWSLFVLVGHDSVVLVDTGSDTPAELPNGPLARRWDIRRAQTLTHQLEQLGLSLRDVTDVIVTHEHWDHTDNLSKVGHARVHTFQGTWDRIRKARRWGRLRALPASGTEPLRDVTVIRAGGHQLDHAVVEIDCRGGPVAVAGDGIYLFENLERGLPTATTETPRQDVKVMGALAERLGPDRLLPGHDPELYERYPAVAPGIALICD